jgi:2-dehydropantoate 2-reductase
MNITVFGAGAIGGLIAARLAATGLRVSLLARGANLDAIRANGLVLRSGAGETQHMLMATADPAELGVQDFVILTVKAHQGVEAARAIGPLLGPRTAVVTAQNGFPWWYFHGLAHPLGEQEIRSVDPGRAQWRLIGPERVVGATVYPAASLEAPGVVRHLSGDAFGFGEPTRTRSQRLDDLAALFAAAGFKPTIHDDIRDDLWPKLWGTIAFNPISALTRATLDVVTSEHGTRELALCLMREAEAVARALGARPNLSVEDRLAKAAKVGAHKTSMLQDLEQGRPLEIEATIGAMAELGRLLAVPTPAIAAILPLVRQLDRARGTARASH